MKEISFQCSPRQAKDDDFISSKIKSLLNLNIEDKIYFEWHKRSVDARKKNVKINRNRFRESKETINSYF